MALIKTDSVHYENIADKIRSKTNTETTYKPSEIPNGIDGVYDAGFAAGQNAGGGEYGEGYDAGKQAEWSAFWDMLQQNGTRIDYQQAFRLVYTDALFKPKYDIVPDNAQCMFAGSKITNLKQLLEDAGVDLDFSNARYMTSIFDSSTVTHVPTINCSNVFSTAISNMFINSKELVYVEKMIVNANTKFANAFTNANSLAEIRFEGAIGEDINFQWSPLSVESMKSIISCLTNLVGTSDEGTRKVTFIDGCWEVLEADSAASNGKTWREYVQFDLGWTV